MKYILDDAGKPVACPDVLAWARWYEKANDARTVGRTKVGGRIMSTVFLGLDHNFGGKGPPMLWETMVFLLKGEKVDLWGERCERYTSAEDARRGHDAIVAELREQLGAAE